MDIQCTACQLVCFVLDHLLFLPAASAYSAPATYQAMCLVKHGVPGYRLLLMDPCLTKLKNNFMD